MNDRQTPALTYGDVVPDRTSGLVDSGARENFKTGAIREPATGKGRFDLVSPFALHRLARHYENGATKYAVRNWEKGLSVSRCMDSAMRHINQYMMGATDEDHLAAAAWNLFAVMHYEANQPEMIDIPTRPEYINREVTR